MSTGWRSATLIPEGYAPHDAEDERRHTVVVLRRLPRDLPNHRHIEILHPSSQGIRHETFGERADEGLGIRQQAIPQPQGAVERRTVVELARRVDDDANVLGAPRAGHVEVLQRQTDGIDHRVAGVAGRVRAVLLHPLAQREQSISGDRFGFLQIRHVRWRGRRRAAEQNLHHPFSTLHRRSPIGERSERKNTSVAQKASAVRVDTVERDAAEPATGDVRNPVVPGEPLVDEGVIRGQELEHAPILADQILEAQLGLALQRICESRIVIRIGQCIGVEFREILKAAASRRRIGWPASPRERPRAFSGPAVRRPPAPITSPLRQLPGARRRVEPTRGSTRAAMPGPDR